MAEIYTEYACRFTGWAYDPATRAEKRVTKHEEAGYGETGLREARRTAKDTREWQQGQDLPVDAVVVSRPIGEWAEVSE